MEAMESFGSAMGGVVNLIKTFLPDGFEIPEDVSEEHMAQRRAEAFNRRPGKLTGYDCPQCLNKGYIAAVRDGAEVTMQCGCLKIRDSLDRLERSGLSEVCEECTFDSYEVTEPWQQTILDAAKAYAENPRGWYALTGQTGTGKTHICTAVTYALIMSGREAVYMQWLHEAAHLKSIIVSEPDEYRRRLDKIRNADVLYIDDLFKGSVTPADVKLAFDIISHRTYKKLITIISSELDLKGLIAVDEAIAGRIIEMCGDNHRCIARDWKKNYRFKKK